MHKVHNVHGSLLCTLVAFVRHFPHGMAVFDVFLGTFFLAITISFFLSTTSIVFFYPYPVEDTLPRHFLSEYANLIAQL